MGGGGRPNGRLRGSSAEVPDLFGVPRRSHLAGALGAAVLTALLDAGWVGRTTTGRGLRITPGGTAGLREAFAIDVASLEPAILDGARDATG